MAKTVKTTARTPQKRLKKRYYKTAEALQINAKWWEEPEDEAHLHVHAVVTKIRESQAYRHEQSLLYARLYQNCEIVGLRGAQILRPDTSSDFLENRVSYNVIKACVDTTAAKLAKNKPRPFFMTEGGNWNLARRAQRLSQYMVGLFDQMGTGSGDLRSLWGLGRRSFVDAGVGGTGVVKFFKDVENATVKAERILPDEIVVDDTEGLYEQPQQLHQEKLVFRSTLAAMYPDHEKEIYDANSGVDAQIRTSTAADMIRVVESWHLPSVEGAEDGVHCITIENATLKHEQYTKRYFPFAFFRWSPRLAGFFGAGIAEELLGIQLEINKILRNIQIAQHLVAVPQVWLDIQSAALARQINNQIGGIKYYSGSAPTFFTPQGMGPEVYQHLESLVNKAYQLVGVSQLSATAQKPAGLNSEPALREYQDIESERFMLTGMRYEDFFMDATWIALDLLDELAEVDKKNPEMWIKQGDFDKKLKWKDVKIPKNQYVLRPFAAGILPSRPEGKFQKAQEFVQAGFFDKEDALDLMDYPDVQEKISLKLAPRKDIERMLERMIDNDSADAYESPEPFMNITYGSQCAQSYYLRGRAEGMPEDKLERLRRFMDECDALQTQAKEQQAAMEAQAAAAAAPQMGAGTPMDPLAAPMAPPTSPLLPNAPTAA